MGKKKEPPQAPDPNQVAAAQTEQNQQTAAYNAALNRINTYTPWGSQTYNITGTDWRTGAPIYEQNIELSPEQRAMYEQQLSQNMALGEYGNQVIGELTGRPDVSLPDMPGELGPVDQYRDRAEEALYGRNTRYLDRDFDRQQEQIRTRLANQGIVEGSEAFDNAMTDFRNERERAYGMAREDAIAGGGAEASRMFGMDLAGRGQDLGMREQMLAEQLSLRNQPINELNALRSMSQIQTPQFSQPATIGTNPADIQNAYYNQYQGQLGTYNANMASNNALMQGLFGLGSAFLLSDERAKENIEPIGELNSGQNIYLYNYKGDPTPQVGVMAQETDPDAVVEGSDGLKRVDYTKVLAKALVA